MTALLTAAILGWALALYYAWRTFVCHEMWRSSLDERAHLGQIAAQRQAMIQALRAKLNCFTDRTRGPGGRFVSSKADA